VDEACDSRLERQLLEDLAAIQAPAHATTGPDLYRAALRAIDQPA
jgi:hypothetical protein